MAATLISNMPPYSFGMMTNQNIARIIAANQAMVRLADAVATASSGFEGTPGTQFEVNMVPGMPIMATNPFGVQADPEKLGQKGLDYAYAVAQLGAVWKTFWDAAQPYIEQLDNGQTGM